MDSDAKLDKILSVLSQHGEALAEIRGSKLVPRVEKLEEYNISNEKRWSKVTLVATGAGVVASTGLHAFLKKVGIL